MFKPILKTELNDTYLSKYGFNVDFWGRIYAKDYNMLEAAKQITGCAFLSKYKEHDENLALSQWLTGWLNGLMSESFSIVISFSDVASMQQEKVILFSKLSSYNDINNKLKVVERTDKTLGIGDVYFYDNAFVKEITNKNDFDHYITLCLLYEIIYMVLQGGDHASIVFYNELNYRILNIQDYEVSFVDSIIDPLLPKIVDQLNIDFARNIYCKYFEWMYVYG